MAFRARHKEGAEVSTESLNDIMFFLMLFFLIISTLVHPSIVKLNLPTTKHTTDLINTQPITVDVTKDEKYYVDNKEVAIADLESTISNIIATKNNSIEAGKEPTVRLSVDKELPVQKLVEVLEVCTRLKVKSVLTTKKSEGKQ